MFTYQKHPRSAYWWVALKNLQQTAHRDVAARFLQATSATQGQSPGVFGEGQRRARNHGVGDGKQTECGVHASLVELFFDFDIDWHSPVGVSFGGFYVFNTFFLGRCNTVHVYYRD